MTQPQPYSRRPSHDWAAARNDFEAGASLRVVAERHGLNIRTVTRHARDEGWRAPTFSPGEAYNLARDARAYDPAALETMAVVNHVLDRDEEALLLRPDTLGLCRFAFRRAAECASVSGPTEALAWVRLAEATARLRKRIDVDVRPLSEADYRRIAALAREEGDAFDQAINDASPPDDDADWLDDDEDEDADDLDLDDDWDDEDEPRDLARQARPTEITPSDPLSCAGEMSEMSESVPRIHAAPDILPRRALLLNTAASAPAMSAADPSHPRNSTDRDTSP